MLRASLLFGFFFVASVCVADDARQRIADRYKAILADAPKRGAAFDRVYGHYADLGQSAALYQNCLTATQHKPDDAKAWLFLGLVAERRNHIEQTIQAYTAAAELEPENFLPMLYLGEVFLNQRRFHEAITALEHADGRLTERAHRTDRRIVLQTLALAYSRFGHWEKSSAVWEQLGALFPKDPDVLIQVAESLEFDGRLDEALQQYRHLIAMADDPFDRVQLSLSAVDIMLRQGDDVAALDALNMLLGNLDSESYLAEAVHDRIERAFQHNRQHNQNTNRQIEFYQHRIERHPGDTASLRRLVQTLQRSDKIAEAEKLLHDTIQVSPRNVSLRLMLADMLVERADIAGAVAQFRAVDQIIPNQPDNLIRWGTLTLHNLAIPEEERRAETVAIWTRIADRLPNDPVAAVQLADLLSRHRFYDEAEDYYKAAVALRPNEFSYREHLSGFYHQQQDTENVLVTLLGASPRDLPNAGQLLLSLGYYAEANQLLREAAEHNPQNVILRYRYLESLLRLDTPESMQAVRVLFANSITQIESDEQFALFLQQAVQLLRSVQKLGEAIDMVREDLESNPSARLYWQLAVFYQAEGNLAAAVAVLTKNNFHLAGIPAYEEPEYRLNVPLLRFAAELYTQVGDTNRAIAFYQRLVRDDPARAGNYWQHIITLQIQRGELSLAFESAQNLLGHGVENAERLRFVADMFLSVHRREEAIKLLRQALTYEPGHTDVLRILAQSLADSQQYEEAIELLWRLYDRLDNFATKLSVIEILTGEYNNLGRVEDLIEHLHHLSRHYDRRRESLQSLARVYILQGDYDEAQHILTSLFDLPEDNRTSPHWVLRELVSLSERQDDFAAAVRYQEILCQRLNDVREQNHLFYLYAQLGDTTRMRRLFFDQVLRQGNLEGRLELIDMMIRREQYDIVAHVLDFLEMHEPERWEIILRRIFVESHRGKPKEQLAEDVSTRRFMELQSLDFPAEQVVRSIIEGGIADWKRLLFYIRTTEYLFEENEETQLEDYVQSVLDELNLEAEDFFPVSQSILRTADVSLVRYRAELQGDRPIDRTKIYALLPEYAEPSDERSSMAELLVSVHAFRRAYRRALERRESPVPTPHPVRIDVEPVDLPDEDVEGELLRLVQELESTDLAGTSAPESRLNSMALALLYTRLQQYEQTAAVLDGMDLTTPSDLLTREWIIARLAVKYAEVHSPLQRRGIEAVDRLLNFRLGDRDLLHLVPILRHFGRYEDVQRIWNQLAATVSDRRLMAELFNEMIAAGEPQKENAAKIAQRILMNPAFLQNPRRLTSEVLLLQATLKVLLSQGRQDSVIPMLESRFRGLRDKTDSRILLARLYMMLDRQDEARALALQLAQHPTHEPERRQMIVSLLVHFGMHRELEAMNRLLLESR